MHSLDLDHLVLSRLVHGLPTDWGDKTPPYGRLIGERAGVYETRVHARVLHDANLAPWQWHERLPAVTCGCSYNFWGGV